MEPADHTISSGGGILGDITLLTFLSYFIVALVSFLIGKNYAVIRQKIPEEMQKKKKKDKKKVKDSDYTKIKKDKKHKKSQLKEELKQE